MDKNIRTIILEIILVAAIVFLSGDFLSVVLVVLAGYYKTEVHKLLEKIIDKVKDTFK